MIFTVSIHLEVSGLKGKVHTGPLRHALCSKAWELVCHNADSVDYQPALQSLRTWVGGFSRLTKGPYLDSPTMRAILFPKARPNAVVGYTERSGDAQSSGKSNLEEDISPEDKVFDKPFKFISLEDAPPTETNSEHAQHRRLYRAQVQS